MIPLNPAFEQHFPKEGETIGHMVISYSEFEFMLAMSLVQAVQAEADDLYRAFFRVRSPGSRIEMADALLKTPLKGMGLARVWVDAKTTMKHCMKIRNQYAHCVWAIKNNELGFSDLDLAAGRDEGFEITTEFVSLPLITEQRDYFANCREWLFHLEHEIKWHTTDPRRRKNMLRWPKPPRLPKPGLFNPRS